MEPSELTESEGQPPNPTPSKQGRQWTVEERALMSARCSGRVVSQETKDKIRATYALKRAARKTLAMETTHPVPQVAPGRHRKLEREYAEAQQRVALLGQQVVAARGAVESAYEEVDRAVYALESLGDESLMAQSEVYRLKCQLLQDGGTPQLSSHPSSGMG